MAESKKKPRAGTRAWDEAMTGSPSYAKNTVLELAGRAERGDREAADKLGEWLDRHPDLRRLVRGLEGLAARAERAWVDALAGPDELARKSVAEDVEALKAELLGPSPSAADRVMVGAVVQAHLAHQRAAVAAAGPAPSPEVRAARERVMTLAQRRLHEAVRGWQQYAAARAKGPKPRVKTPLFEPADAR